MALIPGCRSAVPAAAIEAEWGLDVRTARAGAPRELEPVREPARVSVAHGGRPRSGRPRSPAQTVNVTPRDHLFRRIASMSGAVEAFKWKSAEKSTK